MKRLMLFLMVCCLVGLMQADLSVANGDFEFGTIRSRLIEFGNKEQKPTVKKPHGGSFLPVPISH